MGTIDYSSLSRQSIDGCALDRRIARRILEDTNVELLPLLTEAYLVRKKFVGKSVTIHIINNGQNGYCPEDCHYCAQAKTSKADIEAYPLKSDDEFLAEAKSAYEKGAHRYCMVFAGRGPSASRVERLALIIRKIKEKYPIEVCVSTGLLNYDKAKILKCAGLDRLNHNLNTSKTHYPNICTTHTYQDRIDTLTAARKAKIQLCSGMIAGMNESADDIIDVAYTLRDMKVESIPVNFLMPVSGIQINEQSSLTPEYCLKILALFRFLNPKAEIRIAAGREMQLRSMEVLALYPANSLFLDGYLNVKGSECLRTLQMIKDAGFTIESTINLDELIKAEKTPSPKSSAETFSRTLMKDLTDLRPYQKSQAL